MESSDVFAQEVGGDDPFASSDFGDFDPPGGVEPHAPQDGASAESQAGVKPLEEADPAEPEKREAGALPDLPPEQRAAEARAYREQHGEPEEPTSPLASPGGDGRSEAQAPQIEQPVEPDPEGALGKAQAALEPQADPTLPDTVAVQGDADAPAHASGPATPAEGGDDLAPPPQETGGKSPKRRYLIFQVEGPGKLTQLQWYEDRKGHLAKRGDQGAMRQNVFLARGTGDALRWGYHVVGAPPEGAHLVAVAALHFQPKHVRPQPPEPSRTRLVIG